MSASYVQKEMHDLNSQLYNFKKLLKKFSLPSPDLKVQLKKYHAVINYLLTCYNLTQYQNTRNVR